MVEQRFSSRHFLVLDGLRGLAVVGVILCHVNNRTGGPISADPVVAPLSAAFSLGWIGVDLFFVLSGFLITGILFDAKGSDGYFRTFYARRSLRILPLYYGFLIFVVALNQLGLMSHTWLSLEGLISLATYTYNYRYAFTQQSFWGFQHFWSLVIEEHFYLLWPLVVWSLNRRTLMQVCVSVAAVSFLLRIAVIQSGMWSMAAFLLPPCRLDGLLAGSCIALAWRNDADWAVVRRMREPVLVVVGSLLVGIGLSQRHFVPDINPEQSGQVLDMNGNLVITVGIFAISVFFAALLAVAVDSKEGSRLSRVLRSPGLIAIGKYSYAIYVLHLLILDTTESRILPWFHFPPLAALPPLVSKPAMVLWVLITSFGAAWLSYHLYEKHFLRLKSQFEYRKPAVENASVAAPTQLLIND